LTISQSRHKWALEGWVEGEPRRRWPRLGQERFRSEAASRTAVHLRLAQTLRTVERRQNGAR
jgi:hypothetical protein